MTTSGYLLVTFAIILAIWDLIAVNCWGIESSISWFIRRQAMRHPTLIFAVGLLIGHFWSGIKPE